jgi:hypothetical protein
MDNGNREKDRSCNKKSPKLLVEAGVKVLAPTRE